MKVQQRIDWMDGLKGIACILIFLHHFCLMFYPAIHYGGAVPSKLEGIDTALSQSPLSVVLNGNFLVALFCTVSGAVISLQVMTMEDKSKLADTLIKRYFRLMLPLAPIGILVYGLLRFGLFANLQVAEFTNSPWATFYYREPVTFAKALRAIFVDIWLIGDDTLSTAFWMLSRLFYGTFLSVGLSGICWKYSRRTWLFYLALALVLYGRSDLLLAFTLGTMLAWMYVYVPKWFHWIPGVLLLAAGVFLGGYPSGVKPDNVYRYLGDVYFIDVHIVAACLTLYGLWSLKCLQKLLSVKPFRWLGKISYCVYLLHIPLLFAVSPRLFMALKDRVGYDRSVLITGGASLVLLVLTAWLYRLTVEKLCVKLQTVLLGWFVRPDIRKEQREKERLL